MQTLALTQGDIQSGPDNSSRLTSVLFWVSMSAFAAAIMLMPGLAHADTTTTLPWDTASCTAAKAFTGSWLGWMAAIAIALAAVCWGIGEAKAPLQTVMRIAAGFSSAVSAVSVAGWLIPSMSTTLSASACS
jgi:hypothetical protein